MSHSYKKGTLRQVREGIFGEAAHPLAVLKGAIIVDAGFPPGAAEGGGLAFDYIPKGSTEVRRLVVAHTELGSWVAWEGTLDV